MSEADEKFMDEYDKYNIEQDKYEKHTHSGKGRSKKEAAQHHFEDPAGHTRKILTNFMNNAHKRPEKKVVTTKEDKWCLLFMDKMNQMLPQNSCPSKDLDIGQRISSQEKIERDLSWQWSLPSVDEKAVHVVGAAVFPTCGYFIYDWDFECSYLRISYIRIYFIFIFL